ncbi:MAG TPA: hypothetical protein VFV99_32245 [Kofleriaceae bacterium]|nr:hypothetical protein [Kofleriaceae bacterium]
MQRLLNSSRMRFTPSIALALIALALIACGNDVRNSDDDDNVEPDAGAGGSVVADAMPVPPDGIPPNLTPCEEAAYHSDLAFIQDKIFDVSCTTQCHGDSPPAAQMSLLPGHARVALINVASTTQTGWRRVVPGSSASSLLMVEIGGESGPALEGLMPWGMPKLCDEKIDAIRRWIAAGANP